MTTKKAIIGALENMPGLVESQLTDRVNVYRKMNGETIVSASNVDRRCRELQEEKIVIGIEEKGNNYNTWYLYGEEPKQERLF